MIDIESLNTVFASIVNVVLSSVIAIFSITFITFFFLRDEGLFYAMITAMFPERYHENITRALDSVTLLLARYFTGILSESLLLMVAKKQGFDTFVSDMSTIKDIYKNMLNERGIEWEEGKHTESLILNADEVIKSPGIPDDAPMILKLKSQGTPIISEIEFAGRYTNAKMICITGSNGKTTTTSLIYHIFKKAGIWFCL